MACVDWVREQDAFIAIARKFMDIMKSDNAKPINIIDAEVVFVRNEKRLSTNVESLYKPHQRRLFCFGNTETQVVGYRGSNPQSIIESSRSPSGAV